MVGEPFLETNKCYSFILRIRKNPCLQHKTVNSCMLRDASVLLELSKDAVYLSISFYILKIWSLFANKPNDFVNFASFSNVSKLVYITGQTLETVTIIHICHAKRSVLGLFYSHFNAYIVILKL